MKKLLSVIMALITSCAAAFSFSGCVKDGINGKDGVNGINGASVSSARFDDDGNLILLLTDGKEINCGKVQVPEYENLYFGEVRENDEVTAYVVRSIGSVSSDKVSIPATYKGKPVIGVSENAFFKSDHITEVVIPDSVKEIGKYAFWGCKNLKRIDLGKGVESIADGAFAYCPMLEKIRIPSSVRVMGSDIFCDDTSLYEVVFEDGVERMGRTVFTGCNALKEVDLPDTITGVGIDDKGDYSMFGLFMNCASLKRVRIPAKIEFLPQRFFSGCGALEQVDLRDSIKSIGYAAFYYNGMMSSIILPASLQECESYAFTHVDALNKIYFKGTPAQWNAIQIKRGDNIGGSDEYALRTATSSGIASLFPANATVFFYSATRPASSGNYWHYAPDGFTPITW